MRKVVAGNWKMNHGPAEAARFVGALLPLDEPEDVTVVLFPPAVSLAAARSALGGDASVELGVQSVHGSASGAFTGELSAEMAREAGARWALVGHSERRWLFHETEAETAAKVAASHRAGLVPVLCVGERIEERRAGRLEETIVRQLDAVITADGPGAALRGGAPLLLAYEPVWAIGTGETATPDDAAEAHAILRDAAARRLGGEWAQALPILYGGSVTPDNARSLMAAPGVDGVLVGGASLAPASFARIIEAARPLR